MHRQLRPQHPRRIAFELLGPRSIPRLQCRKFPKGPSHPFAVQLLKRMNLPAENLRSKSWDEFAVPGAPPMDFVVTVCDNASGDGCPIWPGKPITAHWGVADPATVDGTDVEKAVSFRKAFQELETRIKLFTSLPIDSLDSLTLKAMLREIGNREGATKLS